ncbi:MAG: hypothetical protein IT383_04195 [Deltaproteobacteria bacterium]|nr:hypothetical protein [Deltaproteobacteria bacterium]
MTRLRSRSSLFRSFAPLLLCLPLVAAEDDCDITIRLVDGDDGADGGEDGEGDEGQSGYDVDTDRDGLSDGDERDLGTDPENPDTDYDGVIDSADEDTWNPCWEDDCFDQCAFDEECGEGAFCVDGACWWDEVQDSDQDGVSDGDEQAFGTDPYYPDTDFDGLSDFDELYNFGTDPLNADTDFDGIPDAEDPDTTPWGEYDSDGDGLTDAQEQYLGTDPLNGDTDGDGLSDTEELGINIQTDPRNPDSDADGVVDSQDPSPFVDTDGDGLSDYMEGIMGTDPFLADTDGDGLGDFEEIWERGTDPLNPDDGVPEGEECSQNNDCNPDFHCVDGTCELRP